jgi:hypothetical protein
VKLTPKHILMLLTLSAPLITRAQGTFQNLDFESANLTPVPAGHFGEFVPITSALPGWTGYLGSDQTVQVLQNSYALGTATIDIWGPQPSSTLPVIDGNYSVFLQSGSDSPQGGPFVSASIAQVGTIPTNAQSLQYKAAEESQLLSVSFAGNTLTPFVIGSGQESPGDIAYTLWGVDIAPYAGQSGQLEFTDNAVGNVELDDITFSPQAVPEPNALELMLMGGMIFGLQGWRKRGKVTPP